MSDNVRLGMGAFKNMSVTERGNGNTLSNGQLLYRSARPVPPNVRKRRPVYDTGRTGKESAFAKWRIVLPLPV